MHPWQIEVLWQIRDCLADSGRAEAYGSASSPEGLDGWSDLDLRLELSGPTGWREFGLGPLWSWQDARLPSSQVLRVVLVDGRRIDLSVQTGTIELPTPPPDQEIRFDAALAATRYGRGDRLIGLHLTLGILREALVLAMQLRDRDRGTEHHHHGSRLDHRAAMVAELAAGSDDPGVRPTIVERACTLYGDWRTELEADYQPDWSGLRAVINRGLQGPSDR